MRVYSFGCMVTIIIINLHEIELVYRVWLQEVGRRVVSHRLLLVFYLDTAWRVYMQPRTALRSPSLHETLMNGEIVNLPVV